MAFNLEYNPRLLKQFASHRQRLATQLQDLNFLLRCRTHGVIPKFLTLNKQCVPAPLSHILVSTESTLISTYIRQLRLKIAALEKTTYYLYLQLASSLDYISLQNKLAAIFIRITSIVKIKKLRLKKKFQNLCIRNNLHSTVHSKNISQSFINLSDRKLSKTTTNILKLGPKYIPFFNSKSNLTSSLSGFENICKQFPPNIQQYIRASGCFYYKRIYSKPFSSVLLKPSVIPKIKNELKSKNLRIILSDKTKQFVIIDNPSFFNKRESILSDLNVIPINTDPNNKLLNSIHNLNNSKFLKPIKIQIPLYPSTPRLTLNIKTHKPDHPLRPIVNKYCSPTYFLEKFLSQFLNPFISNHPFSIESSLTLTKILSDLYIPKTARFFSLDVVSLFPNIPLNIAYQLILDKIKLSPQHNQYFKFLKSALNLSLFNNFFTVNNQIYKQLDGAGMGSPLSPFLSEIILQSIENSIIPNFISKIVLYKRYADDVLLIWSGTNEDFLTFVSSLNSFYETINFTIEHEQAYSINFLDLNIQRPIFNHKCSFRVFRKNQNFLPITPFKSFQPLKHKLNSLSFYFQRAKSHTSCIYFQKLEINFIFKHALKSGYPINLIRKVHSRIFSSNCKLKNKTKITYTPPIVFHPDLSPLLNMIKRKFNFNIPFTSNPSLSNLLVFDKDPLIPSGGVYSIPISINNQLKFYIGQTKRSLNIRIKEHKNSLKNPINSTSLVKFIHSHPSAIPNWEDTVILAMPSHSGELPIREAFEIYKNKPNCINSDCSYVLDDLYKFLVT